MSRLIKPVGILRISLIVLVFTTICTLLAPTPVLADSDEWAQFHQDPQHAGYSDSRAPHTNRLLWQSGDIGAVDASSLAVAGGRLYVNCGDYIRCLDDTTGAEIWSRPIVGGNTWGSWAGPAYDSGKVFISGTKIYAFDAVTGAPLWAYDIPNDACNGGPMAVNGRVYAGDWDGHHYYCLDANTTDPDGALLWSFDMGGGYAQGTPAYYDDGGDGKIFLTSYSSGGNVWCLNATSGALIWQGQTTNNTCGSPMVADGKVWVTTYNDYGYGEILAFDLNDIGGDGSGDVIWGPVTIERTDSTPAYHDGRIYVCGGCYGYSNEGERTYCIDVATETIVWETPAGSEPGALDIGNWTCSVAVADELVFVGKPAYGGPMAFDYQAIYALDADTGAEVWHYDHGGASPSIANGKVFTIGEGIVWAFGPDWDVNKDGKTNALDVMRVISKLGQHGTAGWIPEDTRFDGSINALDVMTVISHLGE